MTYSACCMPFIKGVQKAPSAEALMRSRYSAYVKSEIDYLEATHDPVTRDSLDIEGTRTWAADSVWHGLEIINTERGGSGDLEGTVEFKARYTLEGKDETHHEVSTFINKDDTWYFHDGHTPSVTLVRESPKIGRNEPCPCGSGKKYKKCCG
jgi:SEC-C motif domain protein